MIPYENALISVIWLHCSSHSMKTTNQTISAVISQQALLTETNCLSPKIFIMFLDCVYPCLIIYSHWVLSHWEEVNSPPLEQLLRTGSRPRERQSALLFCDQSWAFIRNDSAWFRHRKQILNQLQVPANAFYLLSRGGIVMDWVLQPSLRHGPFVFIEHIKTPSIYQAWPLLKLVPGEPLRGAVNEIILY